VITYNDLKPHAQRNVVALPPASRSSLTHVADQGLSLRALSERPLARPRYRGAAGERRRRAFPHFPIQGLSPSEAHALRICQIRPTSARSLIPSGK
jgi:hypothetical protein